MQRTDESRPCTAVPQLTRFAPRPTPPRSVFIPDADTIAGWRDYADKTFGDAWDAHHANRAFGHGDDWSDLRPVVPRKPIPAPRQPSDAA